MMAANSESKHNGFSMSLQAKIKSKREIAQKDFIEWTLFSRNEPAGNNSLKLQKFSLNDSFTIELQDEGGQENSYIAKKQVFMRDLVSQSGSIREKYIALSFRKGKAMKDMEPPVVYLLSQVYQSYQNSMLDLSGAVLESIDKQEAIPDPVYMYVYKNPYLSSKQIKILQNILIRKQIIEDKVKNFTFIQNDQQKVLLGILQNLNRQF